MTNGFLKEISVETIFGIMIIFGVGTSILGAFIIHTFIFCLFDSWCYDRNGTMNFWGGMTGIVSLVMSIALNILGYTFLLYHIKVKND